MAPRKLHGKHSQLPLNFHTKCWIPLSFHGAQGDMIVVFPSPLVFGWRFSFTSSGTVSRKEPSKWLSMRLASSGSADSCLSLGWRYDWMCLQNSLPGYCIQILMLIHLLTHGSVDWDLVFRNLGSEIKWRSSFQQFESDYSTWCDTAIAFCESREVPRTNQSTN